MMRQAAFGAISMGREENAMQNPFVWYDLMTTDVEGAKTFYQKVIGWNYSSKHSGCHTALVGDHGVGGIIEIPEHLKGMPPFWYGYVYTPDVDAACKQVVEYGGKICGSLGILKERCAWRSLPIPTAPFLTSCNLFRRKSARGRLRALPARLVGMNCMPAISIRPGTFIQRCSAGQRAEPSTWDRRLVSINCFRSTTKTSAK